MPEKEMLPVNHRPFSAAAHTAATSALNGRVRIMGRNNSNARVTSVISNLIRPMASPSAMAK